MTTVEKLLVQIFERKNSIIERVKQQTELYNQHLASKLLVNGIIPPSWLWSPNTSSDSEEPNKEELISKLLHPYPQPSLHCSVSHYPVYNNLVATRANEEFSDGVSMENIAFSKGLHGQDDPTVTALTSEDHAVSALNSVPEPDASITSPKDQTDERILNIYNAPDHSLVGFQRSKSRQKALELRNSEKALAKSSLSHKIHDGFSTQIRFSLSPANQVSQKDELPKLAEPSVIVSESCKNLDLEEADCQSKEKGMELNCASITRSRSYARAPVLVKGSLTIGCSLEDCKEVTSSDVYKVRRSGSMPSCDSEQADNYVNKLPKSSGQPTICCQSSGDKKLDGEDCLSKDEETNVYTGRSTWSNIDGKHGNCARDSSKTDSPSDAYRRPDVAMKDSGDDLPSGYIDGSLVRVNPCPLPNESCEARESISEDHKSQREKGAVPSWSSSQDNACVHEISDLDTLADSAKVVGGISPSSGRSALLVNDSTKALSSVKPSVGLFRRVTRSQTQFNDKQTYKDVNCFEKHSFGGTISKSDNKQKSAAKDELQNASSSKSIPLCHGNHDLIDEHGNVALVMASELVLHDHVDQFGSSSSTDAKRRREFESQVPWVPSDSSVFVEAKQLNFNEIEEFALKTFTSNSGKRRLDKSPEKMIYSLPDRAVSLDKGISGGIDLLSLGKQSQEMSDILGKEEEVQRDSFESDIQENSDAQAEKYGHAISEYSQLSSEVNTDTGLNCKIYDVRQDAEIMLAKVVDIPDVQIHPVELHLQHGRESLPEPQIEEGDLNGKGKDKGPLILNASESKHLRPSNSLNSIEEPKGESFDCLLEKIQMTSPVCVVPDKIKQFPLQQSQILSCLEGQVARPDADSSHAENGLVTCSAVWSPHGEKLSLERRLRHASLESWPQPKRRKIEHQQTHSFTTSPSFRVRKPDSSQRGPASKYLENIRKSISTILMDTLDINKSTDMEIHHVMDSNTTEGTESTCLSQNGEVEFCYKEKRERKNLSSFINDRQSGAALLSRLTKKEAGNSQGCCIEGMGTPHSSSDHFDAREPVDGECSQHLCNLEKNINNPNYENLNLANTILEGIQSSKDNGLQTEHSVHSPCNEDVELIDVHESRPVFEGFILDAQADGGELDFPVDGIDFDKLNLPSTAIERASMLAEICRSASLNTPLTHFSSAFEFQRTQNLFWSVPNGHLEHLDLGSSLPLNSVVDKKLLSGSGLADHYSDAFEGIPYSDCPSYSGARYGWNSGNQHASPVGKLWERLSSHTGSSEKCSSSNPELTCFPIEEDPSISAEDKTMDDNTDDIQEEIDSSLANDRDKRHPLQDLTNLGLSPPPSVSAQEETLRADGVDFVSKKISANGTQDKAQRSPKNQYRNKSEIRERQTSPIVDTDARKHQALSIGTNGTKTAKESINNRISKANLQNKTSLKRQEQKLSLKDPKRNNIVLNVSSFIPLVQQKQAATACAGKRDVKVKALEAAEAAKRLEEKRENERKMRKEALKLERAKLEEKNLRDMELERKKKEEERKKKDADIIAKKRLREEEERKEKEKKRMRLEVRQRQRGQEEKMRPQKAEKEKQRSKDEQMNNQKAFHNESKKQQKRETVQGDDVALKKTETKLNTPEVVMNYEECGTSGQSCDAGKVMHTVDKSPKNEDLMVRNSQGNSYEISPYQCSDDEDEEDDELPTKKYIPSWASKSSVALLLPLQQEMDPDAIFPPESFCSMDEVLLPRKVQQKQVAA